MYNTERFRKRKNRFKSCRVKLYAVKLLMPTHSIARFQFIQLHQSRHPTKSHGLVAKLHDKSHAISSRNSVPPFESHNLTAQLPNKSSPPRDTPRAISSPPLPHSSAIHRPATSSSRRSRAASSGATRWPARASGVACAPAP